MLHLALQLKRARFQLTVDISLPSTGVSVFYGHSGSGKTTLLRCIAGLERADEARITFNGETWQDSKRFVAVHRRPLGYVFQEASLFEHLKGRQNLNFALKRANAKNPGIDFHHAVELLGIADVLDRYPAEMSGGERQRVAIARALLVNPHLLLMDEPLASLDLARKKEILPYLERLKDELELPILYVTHSPDEVARLADYLVALENGQVISHGPLSDALSRLDLPIHLGEDAGAILEGRISERDLRWHLAKIEVSGGSLWFRDNGEELGSRVRIRVLARDISLALSPHTDSSILNVLPAEVMEIKTDEHAGLTLVRLQLGENVLIARISSLSASRLEIAQGKRVWAQIKSVAIVQ